MPIISSFCTIANHSIYQNEELIFSQKENDLSTFLLTAYRHLNLNYPKFYKMDNLSKLGILATEILLQNKNLALKYNPFEIGIVLQNASSSLDTDVKYFETTKTMASPALFVYTLPNIVMGEICIKHILKGENAFFIFDKFSPIFLEEYVNNIINNNILQACIGGWIEVFGENYKATLFLIEKENNNDTILFTTENLNKIYHLQNG